MIVQANGISRSPLIPVVITDPAPSITNVIVAVAPVALASIVATPVPRPVIWPMAMLLFVRVCVPPMVTTLAEFVPAVVTLRSPVPTVRIPVV